MLDKDTTPNHQAKVSTSQRISSIWLVPLLALFIGGWMVYDTWSKRGPLVTVQVERAEGIEPGKTLVKTKDVVVGRVEQVALTDDYKAATLTIRMQAKTDAMLVEDTQFWVEKPRIGQEGISGLSTIISGSFIQLLPGSSEQKLLSFIALNKPPLTSVDKPGLRVVITSNHASDLHAGDPVLYRGFPVGQVERVQLNQALNEAEFMLFIEQDYQHLVTEYTKFWSYSGAKLEVNSEGFELAIGSLTSLISGGVGFDQFEQGVSSAMVEHFTSFPLYKDELTAKESQFKEAIEYLLLIEDSIRGLNKGAPVEYLGVRVGTVVEAPYQDLDQQVTSIFDMKIPVLIRIEPERFSGFMQEQELALWEQQFEQFFYQGLKATLRAGNLLTGALFVDMNFYPEEPTYQAYELTADYKVFPFISNSFTQLDQKLTALLDSLNSIQFSEFVDTATQTLEVSQETLKEMSAVSHQVVELLSQEEMHQLPSALLSNLRSLEHALQGLSTDSKAYRELTQTLESLRKVVQDLEPFGERLRDNPRSLLFHSRELNDPQLGKE